MSMALSVQRSIKRRCSWMSTPALSRSVSTSWNSLRLCVRRNCCPLWLPGGKRDGVGGVAACLHSAIIQQHQHHCQQHASGKTVSIGLIRMANIDPLVAVAQCLMQLAPPAGYRIHYCVYHSQHPLAMRSHIERRLDATLTRHQPETLWEVEEIKRAVACDDESNHLLSYWLHRSRKLGVIGIWIGQSLNPAPCARLSNWRGVFSDTVSSRR